VAVHAVSAEVNVGGAVLSRQRAVSRRQSVFPGLVDVALLYLQALSDSDVDAAVDLLADEADFRTPMGVMPGKEADGRFWTASTSPSRTFELVIPGLTGKFPPLRSLDRAGHNLPHQLDDFIGRDVELLDLAALPCGLNRRACRRG
jgi:hypothetical protein